MAFITESELRSKANIAKSRSNITKTASQILNESYRGFNATKVYDVFLSHSFKDSDLILGLKEYFETELNLSVYIDWIEDSQLDRSKVDGKTAQVLRTRMKVCKTLIYAVSKNSTESRWMPWELGYFDGYKNGKVAIMPITSYSSELFQGEEYLQLYQYIEKIPKIYFNDQDRLKIDGKDIKNWIG